jgi:hypothetical protein
MGKGEVGKGEMGRHRFEWKYHTSGFLGRETHETAGLRFNDVNPCDPEKYHAGGLHA